MGQMILFKEIKPKRLQDKAMNAALKRELEAISKDILFDFEATTWSWKHKVKFQRLVSVGPNSTDILVGTDDEIYGYVDQGTKRHFVAPKVAPALAWRTGYQSKTVVGKMVAREGGSFGGFAFDAKGHYVSGIKARRFTKQIQKSWEKKFKSRMERAMKEAAHISDNFYSASFWK